MEVKAANGENVKEFQRKQEPPTMQEQQNSKQDKEAFKDVIEKWMKFLEAGGNIVTFDCKNSLELSAYKYHIYFGNGME